MVITRHAHFKYVWRLPLGQEFPDTTTATMEFTDRAGGQLALFNGTVGTNTITFFEAGEATEGIPAGSNFELFVTLPDNGGTFKVLYGRVVRKEVQFPLNPAVTATFSAVQFEDLMDRDVPGPYWIPKHGQVGMHPIEVDPYNLIIGESAGEGEGEGEGEEESELIESGYGMGVRNLADIFGGTVTLWQEAGVLYYAALKSDTVEITVGLDNAGTGDFCLVLCSNYTMKSWLGVRWRTPNSGDHTMQAVKGTGPVSYEVRGDPVVEAVPSTGKLYKVRFSRPLSRLSVFEANDLGTPLLEWTDTIGEIPHGMGYRYAGAMWDSSLLSTGPVMYYWKAKDDV